MRVIVCGANGAMGQLILAALGNEAAGKVSLDGENGVPRTFEELGKCDADVIIDFSHHSAVADVMAYAKENRMAVVVGTTGHTEEEKAVIFEAAKSIPVFYSGNMSLGIAVLCRLAKEAAKSFPDADIEIVEIHHIRNRAVMGKVDDHIGVTLAQRYKGLGHTVFAVQTDLSGGFIAQCRQNQLTHGTVGTANDHSHTSIPSFLISA